MKNNRLRFLLSLCLLFATYEAWSNPILIDGDRFRTTAGRQILLRGINVAGSSKVPPFRAVRDDKDFAPLRGWGFNSVRLLFNWEAFEPEPGNYDWDYLAYYRRMVDWAAQHGLYAIVDIHQDAFSRFSIGGCGEGFPKWALPPSQSPAKPDNGPNCANWSFRMIFDLPMHDAWHHFHKNTWGVRDRYLIMLQHLAQAVVGAPNLVGFDLMNEPWGTENDELPKLYQDAGVVVRKILPETILFLSSHALTSGGIFASSLSPIPLENIVYSPHYYDPGLFTFQTFTDWALQTSIGNWKNLLKIWRSPMFLGEFGAPVSLPRAADYVDAIYDSMDRELLSGAQWVYTPDWNATQKDGWNAEDFSINDDRGLLRGTYRPRPFVEEVSGDIRSMRWTESTKQLDLTYMPTLDADELFIAVPSRLEWIGVDSPHIAPDCKLTNPHRLSCFSAKIPEAKPRTVTFRFRIRS